MISKYSYIDLIGYERIYDLYMDIKNTLNESDSGIFYDVVQDLNKILYEGIELSYDKSDILNVFKRILYQFLENNYNKTIILFLNSDIVNLELDIFENVYFFDISRNCEIMKYNMISLDTMKELNFILLKEFIMDNYPLVISENDVIKYINKYYKYFICTKCIDVYSQEELIVFSLLSKKNETKQEILPNNFQIDDKIKSYLALL